VGDPQGLDMLRSGLDCGRKPRMRDACTAGRRSVKRYLTDPFTNGAKAFRPLGTKPRIEGERFVARSPRGYILPKIRFVFGHSSRLNDVIYFIRLIDEAVTIRAEMERRGR
jgi:hypothetical protein